MSEYGYCPECGMRGIERERRPNGNDKCSRGHVYPSRSATHPHPMSEEKKKMEALKPCAWLMVVHGVPNLTADEGTALGWQNAGSFPVTPLYRRPSYAEHQLLYGPARRDALWRIVYDTTYHLRYWLVVVVIMLGLAHCFS